ncbi:hypothetical protein H2201_006473 [Coniosporium apollinis]|uniref:Transcription factor domain-containing protein n=1 Tax=Coniosporium apollinis TaxID=61459 RepID=A0ABQ9NLU9_9PEZI|nr:hypothetical protein H2201_006473 [Coniosporium apollinis]
MHTKFGFFDLDATFSVAFVFVLVESIYSSKGSDLFGIHGTLGIFHYLTQHGNRAASKRLADIEQMCDHLSIPLELSTAAGRSAPTEPHLNAVAEPHNGQREDTAARWPNGQEQAPDMERLVPLEEPMSLDWYQPLEPVFPQQIPYPVEDTAIGDNFFGEGTHDVYSLYYNNDLALTGAVESDWEELERHIVLPQ